MAIFLQVGVSTDGTGPDFQHTHIVKMDDKDTPLTTQYRILEAIETLYSYENVTEYCIKVLENDPADDEGE